MDLISKPRSKSVVWTYFGLKADEKGQPLNTGEVICRLCRKIVLAKGGNTTNLRSHLSRRHRADFYELTSFATAGGASFEFQALDLNHEELNEDVPLLQTPTTSNYVPDAVVPPGEPWLHGGPSRAMLSLPACLSLRSDGASSGEEQMELKVYAKCQLQQGVLFGPFLGEVCKGQMPSNLRYAWAIRDDFAFTYVDASDENKSNWMRYVSYTSNEDEHNLVVFQFYRHIYYKVSQSISEGAELRVWIGKDYASLLGLGMSGNAKCEIGDKETALRLLQDVQLVTLPEPSSTSLWSDSSQSQSPMPVISESSSSVTDKYDFLPGSEKLLSHPNAHQHSAWQFFGLEPDPTGRPLDRSMAVCKLCMERVCCGGGAADLQNHLTIKHHLKPRDITKDRVLAAGPRLSHFNAFLSPLTGQVTNAITSFLIKDLQSPTLVEGEGFKQLLHTLLPSYKEPLSSQQLQTILRDHYIKAKINMVQLRAASHFVTLSVDVWLHSWQNSCQHYLTLWAHYIDDCDFSPHNLALATQKLEESGAKDLNLQAVETQVKEMAQEWGVSQPNLVLLGMEERDDSASPEEPQVSAEHFSEGLPSVPCFFSAVQGCVEEVMLHPVIFKTLCQFQGVLSTLLLPPAQKRGLYHHHARKLLHSLTKSEQDRVKLWAHSQPTWNLLYPLLNSLIKHKSLICDIINTSSTSLPSLRSEWKVVEELCLVLKPLDVACRTLAKEAFPRLSLIKPILTGLLSRHLVPRPGDSSSILKEVKRMMRRNLASCYDSPAVNRVLCVACSLDPQFHGLGFMEEKEQVATFNWLKQEAVRIAKEDSDAGENDDCGDPSDPSCHAGLSGMEFLLGDLFCSTPRSRQSSVEESVDMEMSVFRADRGASLGVEPLQWWRTKATQFPLLASVARVYMAAPAVAGNAAQDFAQEGPGRTTNRKRSTIPPESLDAILFLHHNRISTA
uniref:BED-type domain-containing protein n=1 Tax=Poecilia formosa TaxID=48698 RepID=A0A096LTV9_POEFO